ncbi:MmgE/PrpD family protein [Bordetella sp. 02P26C-1]|uniref:MmgE/PrpD family protein n=1 Tax=Bordetella sp. 02P26C-1 TaxID=2683195 RepID=UPI001352D2EA|nr:MmgE/PrpD family protein [Bordetella sp. 02P26C-1]MVW79633.1 MmgE/PrpD family protein [Bordetella sp. 02P26C-1]
MTDQTVTPAALRIAEFSAQFPVEHLTEAAIRTVGRAIVDTVGIGLAAVDEPASLTALRYVRSANPMTNSPQAEGQGRLWTHDESASLTDAAFYNGLIGHVLDFDDVSSPLRGHPSVVMLPALLALGASRRSSGIRLASAYAVGLEVMVKIARAMVSDHYARGWHASTTIGVVGAAAACSHLIGLSVEQTANAIGLAVAQASGTQASFGTMAKSFQTGHCNASALRAALLAEAGMDAASDALDGRQGFIKLYGNGESLDEQMENLGCAPLELVSSGLEIKKYPMCYAAHRSLDAILDLRRTLGFSAEEIAKIEVRSNYRGMVPLIHPGAETGLQAKFSMHYAMAAAAVDGYVRLASFTDEAVQRPAIRRLMAAVSTEEAQGASTPRWNVVSVTLRNGQRHEKEVRVLRGSHADPLSDAELQEKWTDCLNFGGYSDPDQRFFKAALSLERHDIASLTAAMPAPRDNTR